MKKIIFTSIFWISFLLGLHSQETDIKVITFAPNRFRVGDMDYAKSYKGLKYFMEDTKAENPDLYQKLLPAFNRIRTRRNVALVAFTSTATIGTTVLISSLVKATNVSTSDKNFESKSENGMSGYLLGGGIVLGGIILAAIISPKEADVYQFINVHNRANPNKKIDWGLGLNLDPKETVKLTCSF